MKSYVFFFSLLLCLVQLRVNHVVVYCILYSFSISVTFELFLIFNYFKHCYHIHFCTCLPVHMRSSHRIFKVLQRTVFGNLLSSFHSQRLLPVFLFKIVILQFNLFLYVLESIMIEPASKLPTLLCLCNFGQFI